MKPKSPRLAPPPPSPAPTVSSSKKRLSTSSASSSPQIPPPTTPHATFSAPAAKSRAAAAGAPSAGGSISRSISACNRCRSRKTKCDQLFPSCTACTKAGVECIGIDAATGREVPRSYVDWLEKRVKHLEEKMQLEPQMPTEDSENGWAVDTPNGDAGERRGSYVERGGLEEEANHDRSTEKREDKALHLRPDIENLVDQVGLVGVQGTSAPGFIGGSSGISFARLMFAAVKMSNKDSQQPASSASNLGAPSPAASHRRIDTPDPNPPDPSMSSTNIPQNRQRPAPAPFPGRHTAEHLMDIYFQQANPQFPILHRPSYNQVFQRLCDRVDREGGNPHTRGLSPGTGGEYRDPERIQHSADLYFANMAFAIASAMTTSTENLPERYHASAMLHMDSLFLSISLTNNRITGLKGILLLALYSIMRPAAPGVWYVLGTALRLAVDLGLHQETAKAEKLWDPLALDERRRLFWCVYSLDRQVCVYLGRPFGIADDAVKTPFPMDVPDDYISPSGIHPDGIGKKSSRTIAIHMFRIRQLQSEIQQILYQSSEIPRRFQSLDDWRADMETRLKAWQQDAPKNKSDTGCGYNVIFINLNYQQTRLLLYGLSPAVPSPSEEAFHIIADSGSNIISMYRQLHHEKSINYTWVACHNLFMAGTSYLCALWHSPQVRASTTLQQIDFHSMACVNVLSSMINQCPAAQACRDVFESLSQATIQLCNSEFSNATHSHRRPSKRVKTEPAAVPVTTGAGDWYSPHHQHHQQQPQPPLPASLANLLHHPAPPQQPPTPPTPQQYTYEMQYGNGGDAGAGADNMANVDPAFRAVQGDLGPFFAQGGAVEQMHAGGMDGSRLFEMIQEVGAGGIWNSGVVGGGAMMAGGANGWVGMEGWTGFGG